MEYILIDFVIASFGETDLPIKLISSLYFMVTF